MSKKNPVDLHKSSLKDWKSMISSYESKLYDKAIKSADAILKKNPTHVETICIKALSKMQSGQKQESFDIIKVALKTNLKNARCWRTLGQLHSYENQWEQAAKCFKTSLNIEPKSLEVLKELSEIQIHLRDFQGYHESKTSMFFENSSVVGTWMGYATSAYLNGDLELALKIISSYMENIMVAKIKPFSKNRIVCFKLRLLEETGKYNDVLKTLNEYSLLITDKVYVLELTFRVYLKLGQKEKALEAMSNLIDRNTEKYEYHTQYLTVKGLLSEDGSANEENTQKILQHYVELKKKYPRSFAISRIPLTYAKGEQFKNLFIEFIEPNLVKGIPSLFNSLKVLYSDQEKVNIITQVMENILSSIEKDNTFPNSDEKLPITTILWVWTYSARHNDMLKNYNRAFELINKAIEHSPTLEDLYFIKAKFAKHAGNAQVAYRLVDKARAIDIADRFMNTKAAIYGFRCGKYEIAEKTANHFAKEQEGVSNLSHMQAHWYFREAGMCCFNNKEYIKSLDLFKTAMKHYNDYKMDEYDFHNFNHRICSLSQEVDMVRSTDSYFKHKDYFVSSTKSIEIYLILNDEKNNGNKIEGAPEKPLEEALALTKNLEKTNPHRLETHILAFRVNMLRKKFMLALKSLKHAYSISPQDYRVQICKVEFFSSVATEKLNDTLNQVIKLESNENSGLSGVTVQQYVDKLETTTTIQRYTVAKSLSIINKESNKNRISELFLSHQNPTSLSDSILSFNFLVELGLNEVSEKFKSFCTSQFPYSSFFGDTKIPTDQEDLHDKAYEEYEKDRLPNNNNNNNDQN